MERMSTGKFGCSARSTFSNSRPSGPSSEMSRTMKSGIVSRMACRAEVAPSASPQTIRSGSRSINSAKPCRTIGRSSTRNTLHFEGDELTRLAFTLGPPSFCAASEGEDTHHRSPSGKVFSDVQRTADHIRAVVHDIQTHSRVVRGDFGNSFAVILNGQGTLSILRGQADDDVAGVPVLDRVVHGFSRDVVKVRRDTHIVNQDRRATFEAASDSEEILHLFGATRQSRHQPVSIGYNRQKTARKLPRLVDCFIHQVHDLCGVG